MLRPFIPAARFESRRLALAPLGLGLNRGPSAVLQLDLPAAYREADEAALLAAFVIAIARQTRSSDVLVERHIVHALPGSVGPWAESMPIVLREVGAVPSVARDRIRRQLANGERHADFGMASCEAMFADEMKAAGTVAGQFGFAWGRE